VRTRLVGPVPLAAALVIVAACSDAASRGNTAPSKQCSSAAYHQFDFFAGDWDTYDVRAPNKVVAHNTVTHMLGGCAIREVYEKNDGFVGESFSAYDASRGVWHQTWITNRGELLLLDGGLRGDSMVLTGTEKVSNVASSLVRGIWYREGTAVRETADRSRDTGRTWEPWFDIVFRPHAPRNP
jgi:hypothetical protein